MIIITGTSESDGCLPSNNVISSLIAEAFAARGLAVPQGSVSADVNVRIHLLATDRFLTIFPESLVQSVAQRWSIRPCRLI